MKATQDYPYCHTDRVLTRLVLKVTFDQKSRQKVYKLWDNSERRLDDLISHHDQMSQNSIFQMLTQLLIVHFDRLFDVTLDREELWRLYCIYKINAMGVGNGIIQGSPIGGGGGTPSTPPGEGRQNWLNQGFFQKILC